MNSLRKMVLLVVVLVAMALAVPRWTLACTCVVLPPQQAFARSTAVFAGRMTGIEAPAEGSVVSSVDHGLTGSRPGRTCPAARRASTDTWALTPGGRR